MTFELSRRVSILSAVIQSYATTRILQYASPDTTPRMLLLTRCIGTTAELGDSLALYGVLVSGPLNSADECRYCR